MQGDMEIGHVTFRDLSVPQIPRTERMEASGSANQPESVQRTPSSASSDIPAKPPVDVLAEIDRAAARAEELARANRELHFEKDPSSGRIVVQVRDLEGNILRTIPPSAALDMMSGAGL
jgi:flagellar protein FlaG